MTIIKNLFYKNWKSGLNKVSEIQIFYLFNINLILQFNVELTSFDINLFRVIRIELCKNAECDHAGLYFELNLFGLEILYSRYDTRHWDHENNKFEEIGSEKY